MDGCFITLILTGIGVFTSCFWIWMLLECAVKERDIGNKVVWVLIILFLHFPGALLYLFFRRSQRIAQMIREELEGDLELGSLPEPEMKANPAYAPWKEE